MIVKSKSKKIKVTKKCKVKNTLIISNFVSGKHSTNAKIPNKDRREKQKNQVQKYLFGIQFYNP